MSRHTIGASALRNRVAKVFTPTRPVMDQDLFAGRQGELRKIEGAVGQPGQHVIIFGERGVGKTSLANITKILLPYLRKSAITAKINVNADDTFHSIITKLFRTIQLTERREGIGFTSNPKVATTNLASQLPPEFNAFDVRTLIQNLAGMLDLVLIIDEFDRLSKETAIKIADLIKELSDYDVPCTMILVGVAESISDLIGAHPSTERALKQIHMPRMTREEISQIIRKGAEKTGILIENRAHDLICALSSGVPYFTHQLCLHAFSRAVTKEPPLVSTTDVDEAVKIAIEDTHESLRQMYVLAVSSPQKENIFKDVVLACAMSEKNDLGTFAPADLKAPLSHLKGKTYEIASFSRHIGELISEKRGNFLLRVGAPRRYRYKFSNPLMQPYVMMRGHADGTINGTKHSKR